MDRSQILDVGRFVAITFVMLYHFYSRWFELYPYGQQCDIFSHGNLGVEYFFILSGYLIIQSLDRSKDFLSFWKKKMRRLWPALLVSSIMIFFICEVLDRGNVMPMWHDWQNLLASITFISPDLFGKLGWNVNYINGSYWFLWVEIQFLFVVSVIFFLSRKNAKRNILMVFTLGYIVLYIAQRVIANVQTTNRLGIEMSNALITGFSEWFGIFNFFRYSPFFLLGIMFFLLRTNQERKIVLYFILSVVVQMGCETWRWTSAQLGWISVIVILWNMWTLWGEGIQNTQWMDKIAQLGTASYFVYLVHEPIGVMIINSTKTYEEWINMVIPVALIILFNIMGLLYYKAEKSFVKAIGI